MSPVWRILKGLLFWSHGRTTWQYDVMCALILAFIFLTPKSWFDGGKPKPPEMHQNGSKAAQRLLVWPENPGQNPDPQTFEKRARLATGRSDARVTLVREVRDESGKTVAYEVDIE